MAYSTLGWQNGQAPAINASNLNHMDQGIADADAAATAAATIAGQASAAVDGKVSKQTTTSTTKRAYAFDNTGDINVVISADNANGNTIVMRTNAGRIACADPNADGQAATKGYVDDRVQANPTDTAATDLTKLKVGDTTYNIPSGGGSAGVSSIDGATGAILIGGGLTRTGQTINGPDLSGYAEKSYVDNGFVTKLTGTSAAYSVYAFNDGGDVALPVINGTSTGTVEPSSGDAMLKSTNGRIRVATPIGPYHAATKKYVDDNFAPKSTNGYAELDSNGAVQGLKDVFVDFGNIAITAASTTIGQKLYNAFAKYGFAITTGGIHSNGALSGDMPNQIITPYSSTNSSFNFRVQYYSSSDNITIDNVTFYIVDSTGIIIQDT